MAIRSDAATEQSSTSDYAIFGIALYAALALGNLIYKVLEYSVADEESSLYVHRDEDVVFEALESSFAHVDAGSGFLIALGIGAFYYFHSQDDAPYVQAAIAAAAGTAVVLVVLLIGLVALAPDSANFEVGKEIPGLLVSVVGAGLVGALGAFALERSEDLG